MNLFYLIIPFFILILILYILTARCKKEKITIINSKGKTVRIDAEIADSFATRFKGLMGRRSLGEGEGMLFIFPHPDQHSFWMLNTYIPLEALFFDQDGVLIEVLQMEPCGLNVARCWLYRPRKPAGYALEVNKGFSASRSIISGDSRLDIKRI